jgi:hypothetical protein
MFLDSGEPGRIEWFRDYWHGFPKLGLYNEGRGMSAEELNERMDIASTGRPSGLGFDRNYGMGAKMSAGAASPFGLLYRSCKDGAVSEIWLQVQDQPDGGKLLVKVPQQDIDGELEVVRDVTDEALDRGRSLEYDWTEAILLGRNEEDDTCSGAFLGMDSALWLQQLINRRFYSLPEGIVIRNTTVTSSRSDDNQRHAYGLLAALEGSSIAAGNSRRKGEWPCSLKRKRSSGGFRHCS